MISFKMIRPDSKFKKCISSIKFITNSQKLSIKSRMNNKGRKNQMMKIKYKALGLNFQKQLKTISQLN